MFLNKIVERNKRFVEYCFDAHQNGLVEPNSYLIDLDTLVENATKIVNKANELNVDLYFMLKQVGRNPIIAERLMEIGYKGAVVVDFEEAAVMMKHNIHISNVGHLVQPPFSMLQKLVDYNCDYFTVFSIEKIKDINECAKKSNKKQALLLKVVGDNDMIYSGQTAGFRLHELENAIAEIKQLENVEIKGVTSFPCFLYDEKVGKIMPTNNFSTLMEAKKILESNGISVSNINAPSTTSVVTLEAMRGFNVNSGEPGHGMTGTTPLHAYQDCEECPCVLYLSEISHNFDGLSYCYGGGHYRRSHVKNALVGKSLDTAKKVEVIPPTDESIDYYFGISEECDVNDTVIMSFRFQLFVTRSKVYLVENLNSDPKLIGPYTSLGDIYDR